MWFQNFGKSYHNSLLRNSIYFNFRREPFNFNLWNFRILKLLIDLWFRGPYVGLTSKGCIIPSLEGTGPWVFRWCHFPSGLNMEQTDKHLQFRFVGSFIRSTNDGWFFFSLVELDCTHYWIIRSFYTPNMSIQSEICFHLLTKFAWSDDLIVGWLTCVCS